MVLSSISYGAWNTTKPADSDKWNVAAGYIRANWVAIQTALGSDFEDGILDVNEVNIDDANINTLDVNYINCKIRPWVDVMAYGADGNGTTDDKTAIQAAIDAVPSSGGIVFFPPGTYKITGTLIGDSNITFLGCGVSSKITTSSPAMTNLISFTSKSDVRVEGLWISGSSILTDYERLIYFTGCTDVTVTDCVFTNSIIGIQFAACTRAKVLNSKFYNILRQDDYSRGYGVITNGANVDIQVINNHFNDVERHCVYFGAGGTNLIASLNTVASVTGTAFQVYSENGDPTMRNIQITNNVINGITAFGHGGDVNDAIAFTGNVDGFVISGNQIYNNTAGGGILVQNDSTYTNLLKGGIISNNIINECTGDPGIQVLNGSKIQIINNQMKNVADSDYGGIHVAVSGTDVGSICNEILIENNIIENYKYGIVMVGRDANDYALKNLVIGENKLTSIATGKYSMTTDVNYVEYTTKLETFNPLFILDNLAASATDVNLTPHAGAYNGYIMPYKGYVYSIIGKVNGAITAEEVTLNMKINGTKSTLATVDIVAGDLYEKKVIYLNAVAVAEGDWIQIGYTTNASFTPDGSLDIVAGLEIVRDIN